MKTILTILMLFTITLNANVDFNKLVDSLIKQELKSIPKTPCKPKTSKGYV